MYNYQGIRDFTLKTKKKSNSSHYNSKKLVIIGVFFSITLFFSVFGLYLILAPRWTQIGYSNVDWETLDGIYQYPKTRPYLMDYLIPVIITIFCIVGTIYSIFIYKNLKENKTLI
jgi:TRAP-type uncharacterized transport system fused permease subunit